MSKHQDGEHICLYFESYENEEFFKGWLSEDECKSAIIPSYGDDCRIVQVKRHTYARGILVGMNVGIQQATFMKQISLLAALSR